MATHNLAQHEQLLKSLEQSLTEIGKQHESTLNFLIELQDNYNLASSYMKESWSQVINLFVIADKLRASRLKFEEDEQ